MPRFLPTRLLNFEAARHPCILAPAGAVPKDGPSAGVTLAAALVSLFTGKCVRADTAMTGKLPQETLLEPPEMWGALSVRQWNARWRPLPACAPLQQRAPRLPLMQES